MMPADRKSRALGIQARTLEVFADMWTIAEVLFQGNVMHGITAYLSKSTF